MAVIKQGIQVGKQTAFLAIKPSFRMNIILATRRNTDCFNRCHFRQSNMVLTGEHVKVQSGILLIYRSTYHL